MRRVTLCNREHPGGWNWNPFEPITSFAKREGPLHFHYRIVGPSGLTERKYGDKTGMMGDEIFIEINTLVTVGALV